MKDERKKKPQATKQKTIFFFGSTTGQKSPFFNFRVMVLQLHVHRYSSRLVYFKHQRCTKVCQDSGRKDVYYSYVKQSINKPVL